MFETKTLSEILREEPKLFVPGIYDCLSARIMEKNAFPAMYLPADCVAASFCGVPDACLIASADLINVVQRITALSAVSLIADIDSGFGSQINVIRTCERIAACGAKAISLSDKQFLRTPLSRETTSLNDFIGKVEAARYGIGEARCDLLVRVDCAPVLGLDEAIRRCNAAVAHGALGSCITGVTEKADLERICSEVAGVKIFEMVNDEEIRYSCDELMQMGFDVVWAPYVSMCGAMTCIQELATDAYINKNDFKAEERGYSTYAKFELLKIHEWYALGQKFGQEVQDAKDIDPDDYLKSQHSTKQ